MVRMKMQVYKRKLEVWGCNGSSNTTGENLMMASLRDQLLGQKKPAYPCTPSATGPYFRTMSKLLKQ